MSPPIINKRTADVVNSWLRRSVSPEVKAIIRAFAAGEPLTKAQLAAMRRAVGVAMDRIAHDPHPGGGHGRRKLKKIQRRIADDKQRVRNASTIPSMFERRDELMSNKKPSVVSGGGVNGTGKRR